MKVTQEDFGIIIQVNDCGCSDNSTNSTQSIVDKLFGLVNFK